MRVLILGSSGLIGEALVRELYGRGHTVRLWDFQMGPGYDLADPDNLPRLKRAFSICDCVFFFAFDVGGSKYLQAAGDRIITTNNALMKPVFDLLAETGKPFFFGSSQMSEMLEVPYGNVKRMGESIARRLGGKIVRFWNVYGFEPFGERAHVITDFIEMALKSGHVRMRTNGQELRQFLHAEDAATVLADLAERYEALGDEVIEITSGVWTSIREVADIVAKSVPGTLVTPDGQVTDSFQTRRIEPTAGQLPTGLNPRITLKAGIASLVQAHQAAMARPRLSFVLSGRNDNYGGDYLKRLQTFVDWTSFMAKKVGLACEIVLCEWNNPQGAAPLTQALDLSQSVPLRLLRVPAHIHEEFPNPHRQVLFDYIGKNVCIRRSQGEFILITSSDVLVSEKLMRWFASKGPRKNLLYRALRVDVSPTRPEDLSVAGWEAYYQRQIVGRHDPEFPVLFHLQFDGVMFGTSERPYTNACGDFLLMHRDNWNLLRGCPEETDMRTHLDSLTHWHAVHIYPERIFPPDYCIYHLDHARTLTKAIDFEDHELLMERARKGRNNNSRSWGLDGRRLETIEVATQG